VRRRILCVLLAALGVASCNASSPVDPTPTLSRLELALGGRYGSAVLLQNGLPTFFLGGSNGAIEITAYAVDSDGVYSEVLGQSVVTSSNVAIARPPTGASTLTVLPGGSGQVTLTATHSGMTAQLTFAVSTAPRPRSVGANINASGVGDELFWLAYADNPSGGATFLDPAAVQWTSSNPGVVSVTGTTLYAVAPGTADLTLRYGGLESIFRIRIPPYARLRLVP
jgi:hypothetical protein